MLEANAKVDLAPVCDCHHRPVSFDNYTHILPEVGATKGNIHLQ